MLSIGVMSIRHADYYLDLSQEDYYQKGGEPPGVWYGRATEHLGVSGNVCDAEFRNLFRGFSADGSEALTQRQKQEGRAVHRAGWDLTFSAPKSVSVLWSQVSPESRKRIEACHHKAVVTALDYLQDQAGHTRRGKGGARIEVADLVFACFQHGTSRAHDPQLHTHSLMLNVAVRADGTTGSVSSREVFKHKMAAGAIYRAELACLLRQECGIETAQKSKSFEISGVPASLCQEFSKRRAEILGELVDRGLTTAKAAASLTLETRTAKETMPREELYSQWQRVGRQHGWTIEDAERLFDAAPLPRARPRMDFRELVDARGFVREREIVAALAISSTETGLSGKDVQESARELVSRHAVPLGNGRHFTPVATREQPLEPISDFEIEKSLNSVRSTGLRAIAVLPTQEMARAFAQGHGVESMTAHEFLGSARHDNLKLAEILDQVLRSPTPKELLHRFGPDIGEAWREMGRVLENYLRREAPQIDLGIQKAIRNYGPDIMELYRFARAQLRGQTFLNGKTLVVVPHPEKMAARDLIAVCTAADFAGSSLSVVRKLEPWILRERQREIEIQRQASMEMSR